MATSIIEHNVTASNILAGYKIKLPWRYGLKLNKWEKNQLNDAYNFILHNFVLYMRGPCYTLSLPIIKNDRAQNILLLH